MTPISTPTGDPDKTSITFTAFEFTGPGPVLTLRTAPFPTRWLRILRDQWYADPAHRNRNLPTYSLIEMVASLDADILAVARSLEDPRWICAHYDVDDDVLLIAVAAWAATEITPRQPELDWEALLAGAGTRLDWDTETISLGERDIHPNGTANLAGHCYQLLPSYLAGLVVDHGLTIQGKHRTFVLGPVESNGQRSAVSWPPEQMPDKDTGDALWSYEITFHLETIPTYPEPRVHADLSAVRFAYQPVRYVPGNPKKRATLWLHAAQGFLRSRERPTLLAGTAGRRNISGEWRWAWAAALSRALGRLTTRALPDPHAVLADPARYEPHHSQRGGDGQITTLVVYRNGMKMDRPHPATSNNQDEATPKSKTVAHAAGVGFQPIDHMDVHEQLVQRLASTGLSPANTLAKDTTHAVGRRLPRHQPPDQHYSLELWTQPGDTQHAILTAITHPTGLGLTPATDSVPDTEPGTDPTLRFVGDYTLTVSTHPVGRLTSGIDVPRPTDDDPRSLTMLRAAREERVGDIIEALPARTDAPAAIVEIDKPALFDKLKQADPYPAIKTGWAKAGRLPQCLHPIHTHAPSTEQNRKDKRKLAEGTQFLAGDIKRAASALLDSLRQVGRSTLLPPPPGVDGPCELTGIWLERHAGLWVPIIVRVTTTGEIRAELVGLGDIPYTQLPAALLAGHGRLNKDYATSRRQLVNCLTRALNLRATHDRLVLIRSANLRNRSRGWPWLQDQHITPNELLLPGVDPADTNDTPLKPDDVPGLRIVRLRERGSGGEVARAFVSYLETQETGDDVELTQIRKYARTSGLFPLNRWVYYGIAPRSDQAQTPINLTKLDPEQPRNARWAGWNPNPLEIMPAFLQPGEKPADWAAYTQLLRRAHLHTTIPTQMPLPVHLASLADEYLV